VGDIQGILQHISVSAIPLLLAITFHEAAHGWVANKKGDPTAKMLGRVTLNPLAHIDPFGTVILPLLLIFLRSPFLFGYAKPVPVNFRLLRDQKRDPIYVASAGVATNLMMAAAAGIILRVIGVVDPETLLKISGFGLHATADGGLQMVLIPLSLMCVEAVRWNVLLAIFNLIPIPPLDGGRIAVGLLPFKASRALASVEKYGMLVLIALFMFDPFGVLWRIINPVIHLLTDLFLGG
jgi:Zn-dependent protease